MALGVLGLLGGLGGCRRGLSMEGGRGQVLPGGALESEAWVRRLPMERESEFGATVPVESWEVSGENAAEALGRLESRAWCVLTREEEARFVGREIARPNGKGVIVLLRCVQREREPGGQEDTRRVLWSSGTVVVRSSGLRDDYTRLVRAGVVALLPSEPTDVFVEVLTAIW